MADPRRAPRISWTPEALRDVRIVLVASRFNEAITKALVEGARQTLLRHGVKEERLTTFWVSGAFELPVVASVVAESLKPDAIIALGCVIKGETPQYEAIGQAVSQGLVQVSVTARIPVTFGVIITDSEAQAKARVGGAAGHRGREAALAAMATLAVLKDVDRAASTDRSPRRRHALVNG